jgi:hypothetical protein
MPAHSRTLVTRKSHAPSPTDGTGLRGKSHSTHHHCERQDYLLPIRVVLQGLSDVDTGRGTDLVGQEDGRRALAVRTQNGNGLPMSTFDRRKDSPNFCQHCGNHESDHLWICDCGMQLPAGDPTKTLWPCGHKTLHGATLYCPKFGILMVHHCHALGCKKVCPPRWLMCQTHWAQVPPTIQSEVYRTVTLRRSVIDASWAPWWRASARAIAHVAFLQEPNVERRDKFLARAMATADKMEKIK